MSKLTTCTKMPLTPELIERVRTANPLPGERNLKREHVARLKAAIHQCPRAFEWSFVIVPGVGTFRLNGQHSSTAAGELAEEGYPVGQLEAIVTYYECESMTEATMLWSTIDSSMSSRTPGDVIRALTEGEPSVAGLGIRYRKMLASALALNVDGVPGIRRHASFKGAAFVRALRVPILGQFLTETVPPLILQPPSLLASAGAVAAMLRTGLELIHDEDSGEWLAGWRIAQETWSAYWAGVSTGIGLAKGDARLQMRNWLVTEGRARRMEAELEIAATCVRNWNHWREGHPVLTVKRIYRCPEPK